MYELHIGTFTTLVYELHIGTGTTLVYKLHIGTGTTLVYELHIGTVTTLVYELHIGTGTTLVYELQLQQITIFFLLISRQVLLVLLQEKEELQYKILMKFQFYMSKYNTANKRGALHIPPLHSGNEVLHLPHLTA